MPLSFLKHKTNTNTNTNPNERTRTFYIGVTFLAMAVSMGVRMDASST